MAAAPGIRSTRWTVLRIPSFRRYVVAQLASAAGMWNQRVAELWLLLELTGDGLSLGLGTALRTAPALVLAAPAGYLADRYDRRTLLTITQIGRGVVGLAFALLAATDRPPLVAVYAMIFCLGTAAALDAPIRRSFVRDVVDDEHLQAAAGLHTAMISAGRMLGPISAGLLIEFAGLPWAFAMCVVTSLIAVTSIRSIPLRPHTEPAAGRRAERTGPTANAATDVTMPDVLVLLAVFSALGWNLDIVLPMLTGDGGGGGPLAFSGLVIALSLGSFVGSVAGAARASTGRHLSSLAVPLLAFCACLPALAQLDGLVAVSLMLVVAGGFGGLFLAGTNSGLQLAAAPAVQGRMVAVYATIFTGSRALGAPLTGAGIDQFGPRRTLSLLGVVTGAAALAALATLARRRRRRQPATVGAS